MFSLFVRVGKAQLSIRINDYDWQDPCRVWSWLVRYGNTWSRGEGVAYHVDGELAHVRYWEEKNSRRTTWGLRAPWYRYDH